jgi:hypothetical protein
MPRSGDGAKAVIVVERLDGGDVHEPGIYRWCTWGCPANPTFRSESIYVLFVRLSLAGGEPS